MHSKCKVHIKVLVNCYDVSVSLLVKQEFISHLINPQMCIIHLIYVEKNMKKLLVNLQNT